MHNYPELKFIFAELFLFEDNAAYEILYGGDVMSEQRQQRVPEIELIKAIAIIGMVFVHIYELTQFAFSEQDSVQRTFGIIISFFGGIIAAFFKIAFAGLARKYFSAVDTNVDFTRKNGTSERIVVQPLCC